MATSLSLHDPVKSLQRDLVELLRKATEDLADNSMTLPARVHELRKRLKRARAWAQILPKPLARSADRALRDIHRRLGARRDHDATLEAIARLLAISREAGRDNTTVAMLALREQLREPHDTGADAQLTEKNVAGSRNDLRALALLIESAELAGDFSLLAESAASIVRRSRHAMRRAVRSGDPHDFHRWRKWMKYHWFHLRYLAPLWPDLLRVEAEAAEFAAECLGQSQDIELVRRALDASTLNALQQHTVTGLLDREQQRLLQQATSVGLHLHAETPRAFEKRINNYGKARRYRRH